MPKFLIVDDDPLDRKLIKLAFDTISDEAEVIELDNARLSLETILTEKPVATLLDMRMPYVDGITVLKMIRDNEDLEEHLVVMISGSDEPADVDLAISSGANYYFTKPTSLSGYSNMVNDIIKLIPAA